MKVYAELEKIQELLFKNDDMMDLEDLMEAQNMIAELSLKVAQNEGKVEQLVKKFPYLYQKVG